MRKPSDVDNLTKCVKRVSDEIWVYCVECERWKAVVIWSKSDVILRQNGSVKIMGTTEKRFVCAGCYADIAYLLTDIDRAYVMGKVT
jgi:hypothetical protein